MGITTIKLDKKTKERLDKLKVHRRESYDEVLRKVLKILNVCKANPYQARAKLKRIDSVQKDIGGSKVVSKGKNSGRS